MRGTAWRCTATSGRCCTTGMAGRSTSICSTTSDTSVTSVSPRWARSRLRTSASRRRSSPTVSPTRSCGCCPRRMRCRCCGGAEVAFQQLYYTSCEHGVGGYVGFQFNALSPGTGPRAMREVEQLTVYELPSWDSSTADAPVNLCHVRDAARGGTITANVVYAGTDFSGRTGNYFAHALVTADAETDFGDLLPAELWESPAWSRTQAASTTLPLMEAPLPRGSFARPTVAAFLGAQPDARVVLTRLLSAVDKVMNEDRSLVLWTSSSTENAHWI